MSEHNILDQLGVPFPPNAIEQREGGGGRMLDYVATETVIRRLNRVAGSWDFRITEIKVQPMGDAQLLVVWGEMTIPGVGTRAGTGVQVIRERGGEDMWKGAASDCLKKCSTLFNVGIELYGPDLEAGELPERRAQAPTMRQNGNGQQAPQARAGLEPTPKQHGMIRAIAENLGMDDAELHDFAGVESLKDLDRAQTSQLIDRLKQLQGGQDSPQPQADSGVVDWTVFWARARELGFQSKGVLEDAIGVLGPDPQQAYERLLAYAAQSTRQPSLA